MSKFAGLKSCFIVLYIICQNFLMIRALRTNNEMSTRTLIFGLPQIYFTSDFDQVGIYRAGKERKKISLRQATIFYGEKERI